MKIGGVEVTSCEEILVLPRPEGTPDIPFTAIAVSINDEFDKLVPEPAPPTVLKKGGKSVPDFNDKDYKETVKRRDSQRFAFMILKSLEPSNIEWSTVDLEKPNTWLKWDKELKEAGLSETEINRVIATVMAANSLDEDKIDAARKNFLLGQGE